MLALMGLVAFPGRVTADRLAFARARPPDHVRPRAPQAHRQGRRDDLPGADDEPQPVLHDRLPARSRPAAARGHGPGGARGAPSSCSEQVGIPAPEEPARRLSAPALRRHEPARHDRHGDRLQSAAPDRRRADHRARRHHPGADPRPAAVAAAGARHGAGPDHPQHGRGGRDGAAGHGHVCRPDHGGAARTPPPVRRAAASLHGGAARGPARAQRRRPARHHSGVVPGLYDRPQGCLFTPRCAYATEHSRNVRPDRRPGQAGRSAAIIRSAIRTATPRIEADHPVGAEARQRAARSAARQEGADLKRIYEISRGLFKEPGRLQAVGGVSFSPAPARRSRSSANPAAASPRSPAWSR